MADSSNNPMRSGPLWDAVRKALRDAGIGELPVDPPDIADALDASPQELIAAARQQNPSLVDRLLRIISPALFPEEGTRQGLVSALIRHLRPDLIRSLRGGRDNRGGDTPGSQDTPAAPPPSVPAVGRPAVDWTQTYTVTPTSIANDAVDALMAAEPPRNHGDVPGAAVINAMASGVTAAETPQRPRTAREVFQQIGQAIHQRMRREEPRQESSAVTVTPPAPTETASASESTEPTTTAGRFFAGFRRGFTLGPRLAAAGLRRALQSVAYRSLVHPTLAQHVHGLWRIEQAVRHAQHGQPAGQPHRSGAMATAAPMLQAMTATPPNTAPVTDEAASPSPKSVTDGLALPAAPAALASLQTERPVVSRRSGLIMGQASRAMRTAVREGERQQTQPEERVERQTERQQEPEARTFRQTILQQIAGSTIGRTMLNVGRTILTHGRRMRRQAVRALDPRTTGGVLQRLTTSVRNELRPAPQQDDRSVSGQQASRTQRRSVLRMISRTNAGRRMLATGRQAGVMLRRRARQTLGRRVGKQIVGRAATGLLGRIGGGIARLGMAGAGAGAAGGAAAGAAGGLGAAGVAGLALGVGAFAAVLAVAAVPALRRFAEHINESNRELARYNGSIAAAFARLDIGRFQRERLTASETSASSVRLSDAVNEMEEALHPISRDLKTMMNTVGFVAAKLVTFFAMAQETALKFIPGFQMVLDKIEENTRDKADQVAWQLLKELARPNREQELNQQGLRQRQAIDPLWRG